MSGKIPAVPPHQRIQLRLLDIDGAPLRRADVSVSFGLHFVLGTTDDAGLVSFKISVPHPPEGELTVTPRADKSLRQTFKLFIRPHEDAATLPGAQAASTTSATCSAPDRPRRRWPTSPTNLRAPPRPLQAREPPPARRRGHDRARGARPLDRREPRVVEKAPPPPTEASR